MPPRIPDQLTVGTLRFPVYTLGDGRVCFTYKKGSKWIPVRRQTLEALRKEADRIGDGILNAETAAIDLTAEQRRIAIAAFEAIAPTGLQLDSVAREVAALVKLTGSTNLREIGRFYVEKQPSQTVVCPPTMKLVAGLIDALDDYRRSRKYSKDLKRDLELFAAAHPAIENVTERDIREYLRALRGRPDKEKRRHPVGARRRDNVRDALVRLFSFARAEGYLPMDRQTVAEKIPRLKEGKDVSTFTPAELEKMLEHVSKEWLPWMVIAAFAGLRTSEIFRLEWSDVKWEQRDERGLPQPVISVKRTIAKKVRISRLVPMRPNLIAWLQDWRDEHGPLYPHKSWRTLEKQHDLEIKRLEKATGIKWRNNVLRHSFGSHRLAIIKSIDTVSHEMGNSPAKVREDYNDPKPEDVAKKYFDLAPVSPKGRMIDLPLEFRVA